MGREREQVFLLSPRRPPVSDSGPLLTIPEAAPMLRLHPQTLYALVRRGEVPSVRLGKKVFLHRPTLEAWLAGRVSFEPSAEKEGADAQKTTGSERLAGRGRSWTRPIDWPTPAKDNAGPRLETGGQAG
jgi:excisionase family DNA binding protein